MKLRKLIFIFATPVAVVIVLWLARTSRQEQKVKLAEVESASPAKPMVAQTPVTSFSTETTNQQSVTQSPPSGANEFEKWKWLNKMTTIDPYFESQLSGLEAR